MAVQENAAINLKINAALTARARTWSLILNNNAKTAPQKPRMTIEELRELELPCQLTFDVTHLGVHGLSIEVIHIGNSKIFLRDSDGHESCESFSFLNNFPSFKKSKVNFIILHECWDQNGCRGLFTEDGCSLNFQSQTIGHKYGEGILSRKTGNDYWLNLDTWEIKPWIANNVGVYVGK